MTNPKLTDEAVGRLPLSHARAELLEDIMATAPVESVTDRESARRLRRRGTLVAVGTAAATVAALFAVPALLDSPDEPAAQESGRVADQQPARKATSTAAAQPLPAVTGDRLVLTAPGWTLKYTYEGHGELEAQYVNGGQRFDLHRRPAADYESYYDDRSHIVPQPMSDPTSANPTVNQDLEPEALGNDVTPTPAPGKPVSLLGQPGEMWAYSANDHTTIGVVQDGWYPEVRGAGMDEAAYLELLTHVRAVSDKEFEASLPATFVSDAERPAVLEEMTADMAMPPGLRVVSDQSQRYQLGADVARTVACAWLDRWVAARQAGDEQRAATAAAAFVGSRDWAVLAEMNAEGDYPEVLWSYADEVEAGRVPEGYQQGLGCR